MERDVSDGWAIMRRRVTREIDYNAYEDLRRQSGRAEEGLAIIRATLEASADGIVVVDDQHRILEVNEKFGQLWHTPPVVLAARIHQAFVDHIAKQFADPVAGLGRIAAIYAAAGTVRDELVLADGRVIDCFSAPITLPDRGPTGRVTFFRDITAERAAQHQLGRSLANMRHELRTPLNAIVGLSDRLLLEGAEPLTASQREYIAGIEQHGRHLLTLVNDVLDLAKIEAGKQQLNLEPVEIERAFDEILGTLYPLAQRGGVALVGDVVPGRVLADPVRLRQMLENLVSNAVKVTDRGGSVWITARPVGGDIAIAVSDTGCGIAPEDLPGLALTKRLVDLHEGSIEVASTPGSGSMVTIRLRSAT